MRVGILVVGIVLAILGFLLIFSFIGFVLVTIGVIVAIVGAVLPEAPRTAATPELASWLEAWARRIHQTEFTQQTILDRITRIEERVGLRPPGIYAPVPPSPEAPPSPAQPPSPVTAAPPAPAPAAAPTVPAAPFAPAIPAPAPEARVAGGLSRFELELGEKWFQRIGLVVLALAFFFLLAIVLPQLQPIQILAIDFAAAIGLAVLGELLYSRKRLQEYARGLDAGAFALAYIGVYGGGFFFRLPGFPWEIVLGVTLGAHAAASLRYRSPFLSIEAGLFYLAWTTWLRYLLVIDAVEYASLLSLGGVLVLGLVFVQRSELSAAVLMFAFDVVAILAAPFFAPWGFVPILAMGLSTAVVITLFRLQRLVVVPLEIRTLVWATGIALTYAVLIANSLPIGRRGGVDDLAIFATYATLTASLTASELLVREERLTLIFAILVGFLSMPIPLLMGRGEIAIAVFPALLLALALLRPVKGLAWLPNLTYIVLVAFGTLRLQDSSAQFAAIWALFFATAALHGYLQTRSSYGLPSEGIPTDLQVILFAVILAGLGARAVSADASLLAYGLAIPAAIALNRRSLLSAPAVVAAVVATVCLSSVAGRWWAIAPLVTGVGASNAGYVGAYHVVLFTALASWVAIRKSVVASEEFAPAPTVHVSVPALAILVGMFAQDASSVYLFVALPLLVAAVGFNLDDPFSFNAGSVALAAQVALAVMAATSSVSDGVLVLPVFAIIFVAFGFALEIGTPRAVLAKSAQLIGAALWLVVAPIAFGTRVETTILWTGAGAAAVAWGLWRRFTVLRYLGFVLFFSVLGKVFLFDISGLALQLRIIGLIIVAISLLAVSYGYAQYRRRMVAQQP